MNLELTLRRNDESVEVLREGVATSTRVLSPTALVGGRPLAAALHGMNEASPAQLVELGRHLWAALGAPGPSESLTLVIADPELRQLPWSLLHDGHAWLAHTGMRVRVLAERAELVDRPPLSQHPRVAVVDASGDNTQVEDWKATLDDFDRDAQLSLIRYPPALLHTRDPYDIVHLLVAEGETQDGEGLRIRGDGVLPWAQTLDAFGANPPKLVILEVVAGTIERVHRWKAARLAKVARAVVLCASADVPGARGRELVDEMFRGNCGPDVAARQVCAGEPPARWPVVYGALELPRPDRETKEGRWFYDEGWRLRLDRQLQTGAAVAKIDSVARQREKGAACVLVWEGPRKSAPERFLPRLDYEFKQRNTLCRIIPVEWPDSIDWEGDVAGRWEGVFDSHPGGAAFISAVDKKFPVSERQTVVLFTHGVLRPRDEPERYSPAAIRTAYTWWARQIVPRLPAHVIPVLALGIEAEPEFIPEMRAADRRFDEPIDDWVDVLALPTLPDVNSNHVRELIRDFEILPKGADAGAIIDWIIDTTGGRYADTVHYLEQLPWSWRTFARRARSKP